MELRSAEAEQLAHTLAALTGESLTTAVMTALEERLLRVQAKSKAPALQKLILKIGQRCANLPDRDTFS